MFHHSGRIGNISGHYPLFLAYRIFSEAIKKKRRKGWCVAVENCPVHLVWGWLWTRFEWRGSIFSVCYLEWQNTICGSLANAFILFFSSGFCLIIWVDIRGREDENLLSQEEFCRKSLSDSLHWIYGHNAARFTGCAPNLNRVYIHQLVIHLEVLLLITWHRNKHCFSVPATITKPSENWFESSYLHHGEFNSTKFSEKGCTKC